MMVMKILSLIMYINIVFFIEYINIVFLLKKKIYSIYNDDDDDDSNTIAQSTLLLRNTCIVTKGKLYSILHSRTEG